MAYELKYQLHDQTSFDIITENKYSVRGYEVLEPYNKKAVQHAANKQYLECAIISQSNRDIYGRIIEDIENEYTKGNKKYPAYMVKAYHLINEYKYGNPSKTSLPAEKVAFSQKSTKISNDCNNGN